MKSFLFSGRSARMHFALLSACAFAITAFAQNTPAAPVYQDPDTKRLDDDLKVPSGKTLTIESGATLTVSGTFDGTLTKSQVGLANVDNTSDLAKPISTATQTALDAKASLVAMEARTNLGSFVVAPPSGWSWSAMPFEVYRQRDGTFRTSFAPQNYIPTAPTTVLYVDAVVGNDANAGTSWALAFAGLSGALRSTAYTSASGPCIIYVRAGFYSATRGINDSGDGSPFTRTTAVLAVDGVVTMFAGNPGSAFTWTQVDAPNDSCYKVATVLGRRPWDRWQLDAAGRMTQYTSVNSIAAVQSTAGSYYHDGTDLYVHTLAGGAPTDSMVVSFSESETYNRIRTASTGAMIYFRGVAFAGGMKAMYVTGAPAGASLVVFDQCSFRYAEQNGVETVRAGTVVFRDCIAERNGRDGFSYRSTARFLEEDCRGVDNGWNRGSNSNNGSTAHDAATGVRINGWYARNWDRNIHDINAAKTWNLGVVAGYARVTGGDAYAGSDWVVGHPSEADTSVMWLDSCVSEGSVGALNAYGGATLMRARMRHDYLQTGSGTFSSYEP